MPGWRKIKLSNILPQFIRTIIFKRNVRHSVLNSMSQDVLLKKKQKKELEYINGYLLELAQKVNVEAIWNKTVYDLAKVRFQFYPFEPIDANMIINKILEVKN